MSAVAVLRLPLQVDLSGFIALLQRLRVPHRVSEEAGEQVLWVPNAALGEQVRVLYSQYPEGASEALLPAPPVAARRNVLGQLAASPLTAAMLALTLLVALLTWGGENLATVRWLSFTDFRVDGAYLQLSYFSSSMESGQWWRLITPMLLHFGLLHLAMNSLWYWELGRRIEARQGAWMLVGLTLTFSLVANIAQYAVGGPSLFGGLSGVLYGLLGHCWLFQRLAPTPAYKLPKGVLVMMLAWLLICMTGIFELLQFGAIANAAHVGGLVAGCITGIVGGVLARRFQSLP